MSAVSRVMTNPRLLVFILQHAPLKNLLVQQRTSRCFFATIFSMDQMRKRLFYCTTINDRLGGPHFPQFNPFLSPIPDFVTDPSITPKALIRILHVDFYPPSRRIINSWRPMFISNSSIHDVYLDYSSYGTPSTIRIQREGQVIHGLMDKLARTLRKLRKKEGLEGSWCRLRMPLEDSEWLLHFERGQSGDGVHVWEERCDRARNALDDLLSSRYE